MSITRLNELDELTLFMILSQELAIGRYRLAEAIGVTKGRMRGVLRYLSIESYTQPTKKGCKLTAKGEKYLQKLMESNGILKVSYMDLGILSSDDETASLHLRKKAEVEDVGFEHRDTAVRAGARGATVLLYREDVLKVPQVYKSLDDEDEITAERIRENFDLKHGDILVVSFADERWKALKGALAVALAIEQAP